MLRKQDHVPYSSWPYSDCNIQMRSLWNANVKDFPFKNLSRMANTVDQIS